MFTFTGAWPLQYRLYFEDEETRYLHHLLNLKDNSLLKKVFQEDRKSSNKGWMKVVMKDFIDLNINLSLEQITQMTKESFKNLVNSSAKEACFLFLLKEKEKKSKGKEITYLRL